MNVSLTPELEQYIRRKVESGLYNNASEVIREALRVLQGQESTHAGNAQGGPQAKDVRGGLKLLETPLRERGVKALALFGSTARGTSGSDSDIDVLIDIAPDVKFSLVDLVSVKHFLEDRLGREVDVVMREGLDPAIRDRVIREARPVF